MEGAPLGSHSLGYVFLLKLFPCVYIFSKDTGYTNNWSLLLLSFLRYITML